MTKDGIEKESGNRYPDPEGEGGKGGEVPLDGPIGVALDVGTTTIAGAAVDIPSGKVLGTASAPNPQGKWGKDLLARVRAARDPAEFAGMSRAVVEACSLIIEETTGGRPVYAITAAGNTVMEHILLMISPEPLSKVPYKPAFREAKSMKAREAGFSTHPRAALYTFPIIGGFVGGDAVAVALALGLHETDKTVLAVDIGTNSEIILSVKGEIYATSAAAGPAFEAGEIEFGMTAEAGAIQAVEVHNDRIRLDVINDVAPRGICGSGLVDAVRAFLKAGLITPDGRIKDASEVETNLSARIKTSEDGGGGGGGGGGNMLVLHKGAGGEVTLSQADIRALQVAKSAIRAGITILLKKAGLTEGDVEEVYIAGAFGSKLNSDGLVAIGLLDEQWTERLEFVGDAALKGAMLALSNDQKSAAEEIAREAKYVSLSGSRHFQGEFIKNMDFRFYSDV
jgi:uncharacterized 2Fe-2S/4Fe-4S cluster protein (DUF4445 family)